MTDVLFEYDHILMKSEYRMPDLHSHLASHLVLGIGGTLHVMVEGQEFDADAVMIASDVQHTIYMDKGDMLLYLFDTTSDYAIGLKEKYLGDRDYFAVDRELTERLRSIYIDTGQNLQNSDRKMLALLELTRGNGRTDERITDALAYLKELDTVPENIIEILCSKACLSKSRVSHLFKEQMGISLHRYLALDKMKKGYVYFLRYENITEAAMRAGFDSPSHFAGTCKRMFGISFTEFIQSGR